MILDETYTLANGVEVPKLGLGTWFIDDDAAAQAVKDAVTIGYRNIDTAQAYGNERGVGEGVRTASVPREQLFVSSKLAAEIKDHDEAVSAIDQTLQTMGLDHLDLMLIHSPQPWNDFRGGNYDEGNAAAWQALEEAYQAGKLRAIGVSNFQQHDVENLLTNGTIPPMVNQLLCHIGNTPQQLMDFCQGKNILIEAYSPIAHGQILSSEEVGTIAQKYGVEVAQLCIRYALQLDTVPLPKTTNPDHLRSNADVDFEISDEDMNVLRGLVFDDYGDDKKFPVFSGK